MKKLVTRFRLFQFLALFGVLICSAPAFATPTFQGYTSMINGGQRYLKAQQNPAVYANISTNSYTGGGQWTDDAESNPLATTAFALAALLDTGGVTKTDQQVIDGINYILSKVRENGTITDNDNEYNYDVGSALIALSLYGDPPNDTTVSVPKGGTAAQYIGTVDGWVTIAQYRAIVQKAVNYVISHQGTRPYANTSYEGGWTYNYYNYIYGGADMSNTQFAIMGVWYAYTKYLNTFLNIAMPPIENVYASPAGGVLNSATQTVYLSNLLPFIYNAQTPALVADVTIYYTTDGTDPTNAAGTRHTYDDNVGIPITVSPTTLKFYYVDNTVVASPVTSAVKTLTYTIDLTATANVPAEYPFTSKLYGFILRCQAAQGTGGNVSYQATYASFGGSSTSGSGLWALFMIGQEKSPAALKVVDWFNTNYNYNGQANGWVSNITQGSQAYYYSIFGMAKALTGVIGQGVFLGDPVTGHDWSTDLVTQMGLNAIRTPPPIIYVHWRGGGSLDGGSQLSTAWVLLAMAFANINQPATSKIIADNGFNPPIPGTVTIDTTGGVLIDSVKDPVTGAGLPFKIDAVSNGRTMDATAILPIGGLQFQLINVVPAGSSTKLTVLLPAGACDAANAGAFIKADGSLKGNINWYKLVGSAWKGNANIPIDINCTNNTLVVTLTDGGAGDEDGLVNGTIVDPGAPGLDVGTVANALRALRIAVNVGGAATPAESVYLDVATPAVPHVVDIADALLLLRKAVGAI